MAFCTEKQRKDSKRNNRELESEKEIWEFINIGRKREYNQAIKRHRKSGGRISQSC